MYHLFGINIVFVHMGYFQWKIRSYAFCPQKLGRHDCNKTFNQDNYVKWQTNQLLPNLTVLSIITLDNAKYHLVKDNHVPMQSKLEKEQAKAYLEYKSIPFDPAMLAVELKHLVRGTHSSNKQNKTKIIQQAEAQGHKVIFISLLQ